MTVTVYRSTDTNAPGAFNNTAGCLIAILDACLVNGYGSQLPAGWTKAFSGTNKAAYRNSTITPSTGFYLRIDDSATNQSRAVGYEAMTDVDSGTDPFPQEAQVPGGMYLLKDASTAAWMLIADDRAFYFFYQYAGSNKWRSFFFGDIVSRVSPDPYACAIIGRDASGTSTTGENVGRVTTGLNQATQGHYIARNHLGTVKSVNMAKIAWLVGTYLGTSGFAYPNPCDSQLLMDKCFINDDTSSATQYNLRGYLPGFWNPLHSNPENDGDTFSGNGDLAGKDFLLIAPDNSGGIGRLVIETSDTWRA